MTRGATVLPVFEIGRFVRDGYCRLPAAFSANQAAAARAVVHERLIASGYGPDHRYWPTSFTLEQHIDDAPVLDCFTDRLAQAICELVGEQNWSGARNWGLWSVNVGDHRFSGDVIPSTGWHIDGNWFRHTLTSPQQGLVLIGLFTDVTMEDGPTVVAGASHQRTARVLACHPDGLDHRTLFDEVLKQPLGNFDALLGHAGDVWLLHPFLFHTRGARARGAPRYISNTEAPLRTPMQLGDDDARSVLEQSIFGSLRQRETGPAPDAKQCCF